MVAVNSETMFRIGSVTKQFTALSILQLAEQGKVGLQDPITTYLPDYPTQGHTVTVHHLLTHTSGIRSYTSLEEYTKFHRLDLTDEELLDRFANEPFDFAPGEKFKYNNSGYYLLGMIIEKASEESYPDYVKNHIFRPLGMRSSMYCDPTALVQHRARPYDVAEGRLVNSEPISMRPPGAAGALCSTPLDLVRWQHALDHNRLISATSRELMLTGAKLDDGSETGYAYGLSHGELDGHRKVSHGGGITGFSAAFDTYPDDELVVVVLSNTGTANSNGIARNIARMVLGIPLPTAEDLPLPPGWDATYPGTYQVMGRGVRVWAEGDALMIESPVGSARLMYQGGDEFVLESNVEMKFRFVVDAGPAKEIVIVVEGQEIRAARSE
jgi:CubicO group peptidase (beta-lactamase class C family)